MKPRNNSPRPSRHRKRILAMQGVFVLALGAVALRIHYVQSAFGPKLLAQASQTQTTTHTLVAERGALLDRNGNRLAYDVPAYTLDIKTEAFPDLQALAGQLAPILGQSASKIADKLATGKYWVHWPNPILEPDKEKIQSVLGEQHASDVTFTPTQERIYPYGSFAANTLGYVTHDGVGAGGLEAEYNKILSGTNGEISYTRDRWGFPLQTTMHTIKPAVPGQDIELTIDQTIQGFVESKMDELVNQYHPDHAAIIVTDPSTGEILGMASRPTFNPNNYAAAQPEALYNNWAVNDAFEPGSTFKMLTLAAGLATHVITLDQKVLSGHMKVADSTIWDWKRSGWGVITFREGLEYSSNVAFATVAERLKWPNLISFMQKFGFLSKTGIDLPNEAGSIVFPPSARGPVELATSGFGQGIAVTPMQQIAAYGAIANGGKLIVPHLAKAFIDPSTGKTVKTVEPVVKNPQVVPKDVVDEVNNTLVLDVSKGIDSVGQIPGYDVAGKTGTAQKKKEGGGYYQDRFIVSFIGYAPADHPKFEVYVTLDYPKTPEANTWGSTVATPAARDILKECLEYAHIPPKAGTPPAKQSTAVKPDTRYVQTPNLIGQSSANALAALKKAGLVGDVIGQGGPVKSQWPEAGLEVPVGTRMYVWAPGTNNKSGVMPDLTGVSMREAGDILAAIGVNLQPKGDGFAVSQSVAPGAPIQSGQTVVVDFEPPKDPVEQALSSMANNTTSNTTGTDNTN